MLDKSINEDWFDMKYWQGSGTAMGTLMETVLCMSSIQNTSQCTWTCTTPWNYTAHIRKYEWGFDRAFWKYDKISKHLNLLPITNCGKKERI